MNRTRMSEQLTTSEELPDDVVVATSVVHPGRGRMDCPAAPLLRAWLTDRGVRAGLAPLEQPLTSGGPGTASVPTVSYLDPDGRAVGLAVAARKRYADLARECVDEWSAVLRTRRVILPAWPERGRGRREIRVPGARAAECAKASRAWASARRFRERGDTVLLLGHANGHRQDRPAAADPEGCVTVAEMADLTRLGDLDGSRLSFVIRPCAPIEDVTPLLRALRDQFPLLRGQHPSEWCYVMSDRRSSLRLATEGADLLLVLGRPDGPPPTPRDSVPVRYLASLGDLQPQHLLRTYTIAVSATESSTPTPEELIGALSGLGPLSVVKHRVSSRITSSEAVLAHVTS
ncbi:4-hydroxy-3-methylbut-2-enyl diphosphate reductase [Kitasatospora gansuensis]|uniref:4-hydroxy-3-methylbut-2-enyl diphosphate reductase n=1 Tax=Kitasatospora gansuensis TaxID=258050 RepID=A0A7W7SHY2_9ACTN|nr:hypothetical protein [Kitasatospora gansuensis]MBB4950810.1 4-hydroxy-3-methylbut-2-enyl diphosphate reductase [Kitasatospora gansuensis]